MPPRQEAPSYDLTDPDIDVLIGFHERYKAAKRHQRKPLLDEATQTIVMHLEAVGPVTTKVKMSITKPMFDPVLDEYGKWYPTGCWWSPISVLEYLMFEDIKERQQEKKCESDDPKGMFKYYQIVVSELMRGLDTDVKREYEKLAAEGNRLGPPPTVQQSGEACDGSVTKFLRLMWEKLGVYAVTLFGYKGSDGKIIYFWFVASSQCGPYGAKCDVPSTRRVAAFFARMKLLRRVRLWSIGLNGSDQDKNFDTGDPRSMPSRNKKAWKAPPFNPKAKKGRGNEKWIRKTESTSKPAHSNSTGSSHGITTRSKEDDTEDKITSTEEEDYRTSDEEGDKGNGSDIAGSDCEVRWGLPPQRRYLDGCLSTEQYVLASVEDHANFKPYPTTLPKSTSGKSTEPSTSNLQANEPSLPTNSPPHTEPGLTMYTQDALKGNAMDVGAPTASPEVLTSSPPAASTATQSPLADAGNLPLSLPVHIEKHKRAEKQWSTPTEPTLKTGPPKKRPKVSEGFDATLATQSYILHSPCPTQPAPKRSAVPRTQDCQLV
ncbi:hypothetical protein JAAARDRAFT_51784 [Jaapia argillacea MUCL 33604]|uniref:Uncharacterized protein n=1 Tax=Jaapia argillacea MUCL 33604 TaxID=933084 RepID=A0A067P691_9AGAM|nr:hypothetical protein JAAARDRAFT_51784 [Jaapia argillacea MUCL 33604]